VTASYRDPQGRRLKLVLAVLLLVLLLLQVRLWSGTGSLAHINRLEHQIEEQQADNGRLAERNEAQRQEVSDLKNGVDSIEERARSELGLIRKGETFVLVVERDAARADNNQQPLLDARAADDAMEVVPPLAAEGTPMAGDAVEQGDLPETMPSLLPEPGLLPDVPEPTETLP
jgi:cell division protein FtsB